MKARLLHVLELSTGPVRVFKTFVTTRVPLRHPNTWIKWKASTKLLCISLTIFIHFQVPKKLVLLKWEDVRYWFLVFLIHAAGYMSAYPERSGPHQRVFNCHQAMVLSGQKSVYVVFLRNEKINLKVIILRFLSPGKKMLVPQNNEKAKF